MKVPDHPTLVRRMLGARVKKLAARRPVLVASLVRIAEGRRLKELMRESSRLAVALVAGHVQEKRRKAGRS